MSRLRWPGNRAVLGRAVVVCAAAAAGAAGCGGSGDAGGIAAPAPPALSADARAARAAALRFDSLLTHAPAGPAEDAVRGDWLAAALLATEYGAAPRPVTVMINGTARPFEAVAVNRVWRTSEGADFDSLLVVLAWRGDAVTEAILLQWHGGAVTSGPLSSLTAAYHPRGTYQLDADQATLGPWSAAPAAAVGDGPTAAPCTRTRTSGVDPLGACQAGTLSLGATTSFRAPGVAPAGERPDTFVVVLPDRLRISAPRVVE